MKKLVSVLLAFALLITSVPLAFAEGNIEGGGGGMGGGTTSDYWNNGYDGVRISMFDVATKTIKAVEDFTNKSIPKSAIHFGKVSKVSYRKGTALTQNFNDYTHKSLPGMPQIIIDGGSNIKAIRTFFTKSENIKTISEKMGVSYTDIQYGKIKMLLEPIGYFVHKGVGYAMTATEAALFDLKTGGGLKYVMRPFSHNNLPLAMFLESYDKDVDIQPYTGSTTELCKASDSYTDIDNLIKERLGIGIVYEINGTPIDLPPPTGTVNASNYEFRTDTDVIVAVNFVNTGADVISTYESPVYMCFTEPNGTEHNIEFHCPKGNSQLVWFKWRTPSSAGTYTITAQPWQWFNGARRWIADNSTPIICTVTKPEENTPLSKLQRTYPGKLSVSYSKWC